MRFGELVRQHRERSGMSMTMLAENIGISLNYLWRLENGESSSPSAAIVARMVEVLHLTPFETTALLKTLREDTECKGELSQEEAI